jgi:outer membrane protein
MQENTFLMPETPQELPVIPEETKGPAAPKPPFFTFNINTILMLILLVGLAVLYVLFFTEGRGSAKVMPAAKATGQGLDVVFVNIDTLNERYEFVTDLKRNLESHGGKLQNELLSEQAALQKEFNDLQKLIQGNAVTEERAGTLYQNLMQKQQALEEKKNRYTQDVAEKEYNMQVQLLDTVDNFLRRFNKIYRYDYILGYKTAGEILIANDTLDITSVVVDELNKEYRAHNK